MPEPLAGDVSAGRVRYAPVKSLWLSSMVLGAGLGGMLTFSIAAFALFVGLTLMTLLLGHTLGSHRKLIHDSFACPGWLEVALVWWGVQVGLAGPLGLKRQHDLRDLAQRRADCHPYLRHGRSLWMDAWWQLHCDLVLDDPPPLPDPRHLEHDATLCWLERTWMLQVLTTALPLWALGGWGFVWWGVCARVAACVIGHWLVGYFAHNHGHQPVLLPGVAVQGRNLPWLSLITMGECWHNNHHANPGSARLGVRPGEWDPGWWVLSLWARLGWVWAPRLPGVVAEPGGPTYVVEVV
ncbi:MAG: fatty acid desaturase [Burkholderiales bacterium]|nr:fatty acid desaturase [Burkholderiales bacterium]